MQHTTTNPTFVQPLRRQLSRLLQIGLLLLLAPISKAYGDNAREIIGKWELREIHAGVAIYKPKKGDKSIITEYLKDGTFTTSAGVSGTYQFVKDSVLQTSSTVKGKATTKEYEIRILSNSMTLRSAGTSPSITVEEKYRRVN